MLNRYRQLRHFLLIALIAFTLVGVQLVQFSPLHDHPRDTFDCALCHLQFGDNALIQHHLTVQFSSTAAQVAVPVPKFHVTSTPSPYQGRAPPLSLS